MECQPVPNQNIEKRPLQSVEAQKILDLFNHSDVIAQMPLASPSFTESDYDGWISTKKMLWDTHGYGPWAFYVAGQFAGWGGLQDENGAADLGLVLHPRFWGYGLKIYRMIITEAFLDLQLPKVTVLLPDSRLPAVWMRRLGFTQEDQLEISGINFHRFQLKNPKFHTIADK